MVSMVVFRGVWMTSEQLLWYSGALLLCPSFLGAMEARTL